MEASIETLVNKIKKTSVSSVDPYLFISPCAYETAWLAMVPNTNKPDQPMFKNCLNWVLKNQKKEGFWGDYDVHGMPNIECLPSTIACIIALHKWNVGTIAIEKGLEFIQANLEKLIKENVEFPRWFNITFPAMMEMSHSFGIEIIFPETLKGILTNMFINRQQILKKEKLFNDKDFPPLLSYLEAIPPSYSIDHEDIIKNMDGDGSLFRSPSATACAFMATGSKICLEYLQSVVERCPNGVPLTYPMDEELLQLCVVNQLQRLGLAEHFVQEIDGVLAQAYRNYKNRESQPKSINLFSTKLYKDSLVFRLLRMHGYNVSPRSFCWFLLDENILEIIENNYEYFSNVMLNVYRATDLMFPQEHEIEDARLFSRKILEKILMTEKTSDLNQVSSPNHIMIEYELKQPWICRLDHLEHRMWIEGNEITSLWMGKNYFHRLSDIYSKALMQLAVLNYHFRQSIYKNELNELKRWSKECGLSEMGFGREKTTYCYYATAASYVGLRDSDIRISIAKSAILVTVADDFYDMEGSLNELRSLTSAVQRWDGKGLFGHGQIIFNALDDLVTEISVKNYNEKKLDITKHIQDIWYETFVAWHMEAEWSESRSKPSMDEYIKTAMLSIAAHTVAVPASSFLNPNLPSYTFKSGHYETLTKLLMLTSRLLNDIQSYQKEEEGKVNMVLLYLEENPEAKIEDAITHTKEIIDGKKKELLQHALMEDFSDLSKSCRYLHLSCFKVFQMFFNSKNLFDSDTELLQDINKAIYFPIQVQTSKMLKPLSLHSGTKDNTKIVNHFKHPFKSYSQRSISVRGFSSPVLLDRIGTVFTPPRFLSSV